MGVLKLVVDELGLLVVSQLLQVTNQLPEGKIGSYRLDIPLYLSYRFFVSFYLLVVEKRVDQEVGLKCQHSQRPYVHSLCVLLLLLKQQLRRPVNNSTCHLACSLVLGGSPEICYFEGALRINHILRLDISVDDLLLMDKHQSIGDIHQHLDVLILDQMVHLNFVS